MYRLEKQYRTARAEKLFRPISIQGKGWFPVVFGNEAAWLSILFSFSQLNGKREVKKGYLMWSAPSVLEPLLCWLYSNGSSMLMPTSPERGFHHVSSVWWREKARPSSLLPSSIYKPDGVHVLQSARKSSQITTKKKRSQRFVSFQCAYESPHLSAHLFSL